MNDIPFLLIFNELSRIVQYENYRIVYTSKKIFSMKKIMNVSTIFNLFDHIKGDFLQEFRSKLNSSYANDIIEILNDTSLVC